MAQLARPASSESGRGRADLPPENHGKLEFSFGLVYYLYSYVRDNQAGCFREAVSRLSVYSNTLEV